jgi:hypothetical protein
MYNSIRKECPNCSCTPCIKHPKTTEEGYSIDIYHLFLLSLQPMPNTFGHFRRIQVFNPYVGPPQHQNFGKSCLCPSFTMHQALSIASGNLPMLFDNTTACDVYMLPKDTPCRIAIASKIGSLQNNSSTHKHLPISFVQWKDNCANLWSQTRHRRQEAFGFGPLHYAEKAGRLDIS